MTMSKISFKISSGVLIIVSFILIMRWIQDPSSVIQINLFLRGEHKVEDSIYDIRADQTQIERRAAMNQFCSQHIFDRSLKYGESFFYNDKKEFVFCRIPKVACTTWKKVLAYTLDMVESPFNVSLDTLYSLNLPYMESIKNHTELQRKKANYFSFMYSRHPYDRLFSAYRNKFLNPWHARTYYLETAGPRIVTAIGGDVVTHPKRMLNGKSLLNITFENFLTYLIKGGSEEDDHWKPQTRLCRICDYPFNFLGHFETLNQDANKIFRHLHLDLKLPEEIDYKQKTVDILRDYYKEIPKSLLMKVFHVYKDDFLAFGYDPNKFFTL